MKFESVHKNTENIPERGVEVTILLKLIRHGERDKEGNLLDHGRDITRQRARESKITHDEYDAVKAIGSDAGPKGPVGMQRSLETADIYAHEIAGDEAFNTRINKILSYENIKSPTPYDHVAIYNSFLPENFNSLPPEEKVKASKQAQTGVVNHVFSLQTPEADAYRREVAGSFAHIIEHYEEVAQRLKSKSKVLIPAGTHGGTMEFLLQQALSQRNESGEEVIGMQSTSEIGGEFDPSDSYNISIETDAEGKIKQPIRISFDNPNRPQGREMYLNPQKLKELAQFYNNLHMKE